MFDDTIRVHQNTGSTNPAQLFSTATAVSFPTGSLPADLYAADMDRDGWEDLVSITAVTNDVVWHRNDSTPFDADWDLGAKIFNGPNGDGFTPRGAGVFAADMDGDLDLDVVATSFGEDRVDWFRNLNGGITWSGRLSIAGSIDGANPPAVADIDGDEDMDVLTPALFGDKLYFHRNNGSGSFSLRDSVEFDTPTNVAIADINGDGVLDIVAGGHDKDRISWWENPRTPAEIVVTGNGHPITDGDNDPETKDGTDFGVAIRDGAPIEHTFVIENTEEGTLAVGEMTVPAGFKVVKGPDLFVPPGDSTEFTIELETKNSGTRTGEIRFATNDSNENPFNFWITGTVRSPIPQEARVTGNGREIEDGDTTPSKEDGTDFGSVMQGGTPISQTFVVHNDGDFPLTLGIPTVPLGYTVSEPLNLSLAPRTSDSFTVKLIDTSMPGTKSGMIQFETNDTGENPYNFVITGKVTGPDVTVFLNDVKIEDCPTSPCTDPDDCIDFGFVVEGGAPVTRTFTVRNDGNVTLTLSGLTVPDGYSKTNDLSASLSPGNSDTFTVQLDTTKAGTKTGEIRFTNNDPDENPFNFCIRGQVLIPGDYNRDGRVDQEDNHVWRGSFGRTGPGLPADGNGNGVVDLADYVVWRNNLGRVAASNATASDEVSAGSVGSVTASAEPPFDATNVDVDQTTGTPAVVDSNAIASAHIVPTQPGRFALIERASGLLATRIVKPSSASRASRALVADANFDNRRLLLAHAPPSGTLSSDLELADADYAFGREEAVEALDAALAALGDDQENTWRIFW
jgi:hypothetical protein